MKMLIILAWRNLWRKKRRTLITVSSVMFAVVLAIMLMSVVGGMKEQMIDFIVSNSTGHLQVQDVLYHDEPSMDHALLYDEELKGILEKHAGAISYTVPRIQGFCLGAKDMGTRGVLVTGILPDKEDRMNDLSSRLIKGRMFSETERFAVIAEGVATQLGLSIGDTIVLLGQGFQGMTAAGKFEIGGILSFPLPEQNNAMVYLPLKEAQWFFAAPDRLNALILMLEDESTVDEAAVALQQDLDPEWFAVRTYEELMPDAVAAFEARDAQIKVFAFVLYIVAGFGIFGTIITMMHERLKEFGILLSIGLKRTQLAGICLIETVMMSVLGVLAGVGVGIPITWWLYNNPIPLKDELAEAMLDYGLEPYFSFSIASDIFIYQAITIFLISLVVGMYPVRKVFRLNMVSAARENKQ